MADYSSLDIRQKSASTETPPAIRRQQEVAKLIDVSKCIGCKACQSACEEWNDLRDDVGINVGVYDNPHDLTAKSWTLMRFTEYENAETNNLEWLIRKDGCIIAPTRAASRPARRRARSCSTRTASSTSSRITASAAAIA